MSIKGTHMVCTNAPAETFEEPPMFSTSPQKSETFFGCKIYRFRFIWKFISGNYKSTNMLTFNALQVYTLGADGRNRQRKTTP